MTSWKITPTKNDIKINNPTFIEGLPGLGNVGKVVTDIIIEELGAEKLIDIFSYKMPNSVFVNDKNLVDLPKIEIYHKKISGKDFLILTGDVQPSDEVASYEFTEQILDIIEQYKCAEIITLGGIGLEESPTKPKVFCTGNHSELVKEFKQYKVNTRVSGVVGPIIGVSGLLLGLGQRRNIRAASLLAETYGHPMYVGLRGAKEILKVLNKKYGLGVSFKRLNEEIKEYENELSEDSEPKKTKFSKIKNYKDMSYIG